MCPHYPFHEYLHPSPPGTTWHLAPPLEAAAWPPQSSWPPLAYQHACQLPYPPSLFCPCNYLLLPTLVLTWHNPWRRKQQQLGPLPSPVIQATTYSPTPSHPSTGLCTPIPSPNPSVYHLLMPLTWDHPWRRQPVYNQRVACAPVPEQSGLLQAAGAALGVKVLQGRVVA
jgi:hypothetical protein